MAYEEIIIGDCRLIHGDCREVLPLLPKHDLLLTDPPYGIKQDKGFDGFDGFGGFGKPIYRRQYECKWDMNRPEQETLALCVQSAKTAIIWGGQYFADLLPAQGKWLWWDKCQTMPTFGDGELAWTNLQGVAPKKFVYSNNGLMAKEKNRKHPTQKPIALIVWCISFAPKSKTVIDPFMGSGTTGVACAQLGKAFTGIERERKYFDIAVKRIERAQAQGKLLLPDAPQRAVQEVLL